jgi:hypothetical protein
MEWAKPAAVAAGPRLVAVAPTLAVRSVLPFWIACVEKKHLPFDYP